MILTLRHFWLQPQLFVDGPTVAFNVSTTIEVLSDLRASMNDLVRVIESEDSPLGDN